MDKIYEDAYQPENGKCIDKDIIKILADNGYTISRARYLFNRIIEQLERKMPISEKIDC